jgi:hypothetical protein
MLIEIAICHLTPVCFGMISELNHSNKFNGRRCESWFVNRVGMVGVFDVMAGGR